MFIKQTFSVRFNVEMGRLAVAHISSVAGSLPPRRGASFKQRPKHNKRLCLFRARLLWAGGDAFFQRGGFFAAAPWYIFQATPSMFRARLLGGR
jgi:hypothetical protein